MSDLATVNLTIPLWQMMFYIGLVSFFMVRHQTNFFLLTTYLFAIYCVYYLSGSETLAAVRGDAVVGTAYIIFGLALLAFSLMSLFYRE